MEISNMPKFITAITIFIIFIFIFYWIYYSTLANRECNNMNSIYGTVNGKLSSIDPNLSKFQYSLRDYYIKTAYNACSGGSYKNDYVDTCILKNILKQGVRCLDFQIFSINDLPVVATSTSTNFHVKETFNSVNFEDVMNIIVNYAFTLSTSPNPLDPIFIHLRIHSNNQNMYKNMAKIFEKYDDKLLGKEYSYEMHGQNFGKTKLSELVGKIIIIVDKINNSFLDCQEFYEYVNLTSNSVFMRALHYNDIQFTPDMEELISFNRQNMTIGMPNKGSEPENPSGVVMREMGCQFLGMRYQLIDTNIEENDAFFNNNGFAFVLKPEDLRYKEVTIDEPPKQKPELSYAPREVKGDYYSFQI